MNEKRDFKGVWIPKELWFDKTLSPIQKMFLLEIDSLDNEAGCFASNAHFSELFGVTKGRCTQIIKGLEARKLVTIRLIREGKQIKKRIVRVVNKLNRGSENIKSPYLINAQGNNTSKAIEQKEESKKKPSSPGFSENDLKLADFMYAKIQQLNPGHKKPNLDKWANTIRLIRERDNKTHNDIESLFTWANNNNFWKTNILSPAKLRDQWDTLTIQRQQNETSNQNSNPGKNSVFWDSIRPGLHS